MKQYLFYLLYTLVHLKNPIYMWNEDSGMNYDTSKWFLLFICIPKLFSRDNHSKREYPFISIYALLISQEFASFCSMCEVNRYLPFWLKFTWLNADLYIFKVETQSSYHELVGLKLVTMFINTQINNGMKCV